jgi:hypothetical protein
MLTEVSDEDWWTALQNKDQKLDATPRKIDQPREDYSNV